MTNVNFIGNVYFKGKPFDVTAAVYMNIIGSSNTLMFNRCNFIGNTFSQGTKALYINEHASGLCISPRNQIIISNCSISYNAIYDGGKILYIDGQSDYDIQISNTVFVDNLINDYTINVVMNSAKIDTYCIKFNFMGNKVTQSGIFLQKNS